MNVSGETGIQRQMGRRTELKFHPDLDLNERETLILGPGNVQFFDLSQQNLKEFPQHLYKECVHVKCMYLEGNFLQDLGESFFPSLPNLQWLDARNNVLRTLPKSIANHPNLEVLLLQGNKLEVLPLELGLVPKLRGIQLLGNPIVFPPHQVLEKGVESVIEFLREEHNIQAPSPSTIRPIAEPFYKGMEFKDDPALWKYKLKPMSRRRQSCVVAKKRATSSNLPPITVKSYQKLDQDPRPKTSVPISRYKLSATPPAEENDMSKRIRSVGSRILQLWPASIPDRSRAEDRIEETYLKEMFVNRIKELLAKQAALIQKTKDKETLKKWRHSGARVGCRPEARVSCRPAEVPYDTDPAYMTIPSRAELRHPAARQHNRPADRIVRDVGEEMTEILRSLQQLDNSRSDKVFSPRTEQKILNSEIETLVQLQNKLQILHFRNAQQDIPVPSLPIRGHRINVQSRKSTARLCDA